MSDDQLPESWAWSSFSEVAVIAANLVSPSDWPKLPHIAPDNIERDTGHLLPYRRIEEDGVTSSKHLFKPGQILYSKIRPYLNKCVSIDFRGLCSADMYPVEPQIDRAFLHNYMLSQAFVTDVSDASGSRTILPKTNQKQLSKVPVPVAPLPEQHRIVEAIESYVSRLDAAVATLERVQRNLKRYRASVLKAAVEGKLVPTEAELAREEGRDYEPASALLERILLERRRRWEEDELAKMKAKGKAPKNDQWKKKYKEPEAPDTDGLPELPEGWCWGTVRALEATSENPICAGPFGTIFKAHDFRPVGIPIIFLRHVKPDRYLTHKPKYMLKERWDQIFQDYSVYGGELLVSKLGDPPGDCCIFPHQFGPSMLTPDVMKLEVNEDLVAPRFVMHYINSEVARNFVFGAAFGTTRLRLTLPIFRGMPVPIPPISEQVRIVEEVDRLLTVSEAQEEAVVKSAQRCAKLRQSILKWAFEGKLADQDPDDEPASALLERIQAEQAKAPPKKPRRGRTPSRKNA